MLPLPSKHDDRRLEGDLQRQGRMCRSTADGQQCLPLQQLAYFVIVLDIGEVPRRTDGRERKVTTHLVVLCFELLYLLSKLLPNGFGDAFAIDEVCRRLQSQQGFIPARVG